MAYYYTCKSCSLHGYAKDERGLRTMVNHKIEHESHKLLLQIVDERPDGLRGFIGHILNNKA